MPGVMQSRRREKYPSQPHAQGTLSTTPAADTGEDLTDTVTCEIAVPQIELEELSFSGDDNYRMLDITTTFAETQGPPIESPEWKAEGDPKPICYKMKSTPKITAKFKVKPSLEGNSMTVKVKAEFKQESHEVKFAEKSLTLTGASGEVPNWASEGPLKDSIFNGDFSGTFKISYDKTDSFEDMDQKPKTPLYAVFDEPQGVKSSKRIDYLTKKAKDQDDLEAICRSSLSAAILLRFNARNSYFGSPSGTKLSSLWQVLDGTDADCVTLVYLLKEAKELLGFDEGDVSFIYASHYDWSRLEQNLASSALCQKRRDDGSFSPLTFLSVAGTSASTNYFEGTFKVGGTYFMVPGGEENNAKGVLFHVARKPPGISMQRWENALNGHPVPFPEN
jgi:hypothetical protein